MRLTPSLNTLNVPKDIKVLLNHLISHFRSVLKQNLVGVYLHGSAAMGSFNPVLSDIDIIVVVEKPVSVGQKKAIIDFLLNTNSIRKRLDVSILREDIIRNPRYPIFVELRYTPPDNILVDQFDKGVVAHLYSTEKRGMCIWGKPIDEVFKRTFAKYYLLSIIDDLKNSERCLSGKNASWILNACRTIGYIKERRVLSKIEGGKWALDNFPSKFTEIIAKAITIQSSYLTDKIILWNNKDIEEFTRFVFKEIEKEKKKSLLNKYGKS